MIDPSAPAPLVPDPVASHDDQYAQAKQIDELGGQWSFPVFNVRATNFHSAARQSVLYYETLPGYLSVYLTAAHLERARQVSEGWLTRMPRPARRAQQPPLSTHELGVVQIMYDAHASVFEPVNGRLQLPTDDDPFVGRHCAQVIGVLPRDRSIRIHHRWEDWTPDGTAVLPAEYGTRYARGGFTYRPWDRGPTGRTSRRIAATRSAKRMCQLWRGHRAIAVQTVATDDERLLVTWYPTASVLTTGAKALVTLETAQSIRVGVAILAERREAVLEELFIWPPYRRRGLGTLLEACVAEHATREGAHSLAAALWEADALRGTTRAMSFLTSRGYAASPPSENGYGLVASKALR